MAESPSHRFGQIIGDLLESAVHEPLRRVADEFRLYLDFKHPRAARGGKSKVSWRDQQGNAHDLDYVLERGGSEQQLGTPKAFIETAWRRYTKHSRNKAQEIQGAIVPLAEAYRADRPFLGAVLAGVFTPPSLTQLESHGFRVLHFPYEDVLAAFRHVGIEAHFDEHTTDAAFWKKVEAFERLSDDRRSELAKALRSGRAADLGAFLAALRESLAREVRLIRVLPLFGLAVEVETIAAAERAITELDETAPDGDFCRYEVTVLYSNGDEVRGEFRQKADALRFLSRA